MSIKKIKFILGIFIPFLSIFLMSHNTFAVSLSTSSFDLHYAPNGTSTYRWQNGMSYGSSSGGTQNVNYVNLTTGSGYANLYQFTTPSVSATGNYVTINFETNIVTTSVSSNYRGNFVNLPYMSIQSCSGTGAYANMQVIDKSLSTAVTNWNNGASSTLTFYGSISYRNVGQGSSGTITCQIGNPNYAFLSTANAYSTTYVNRVYFEHNVGTINFSTNINDALLQMQVNQNSTIINQNQQIIDQQSQNTQEIIDNQNQNTEDIIKSNQNCSNFDETFSNSDITNAGHFLSADGSEGTNSSWGIIEYIPFYPDFTYEVTLQGTGNSPSFCQYNEYKSLISCGAYLERSSFTFTAAANAKYLSLSIPDRSNARIRVVSDEEICKNINQEYYDEQRQADQNIANQTPSDIDGATNQQTTNLIGTISSFVSALGSINTNGSCQLTLPFPSLIGGDQVVNPCNGADKAPAIITAASSLLLITVFVPLAFILVKMIYSEIRSFTNG